MNTEEETASRRPKTEWSEDGCSAAAALPRHSNSAAASTTPCVSLHLLQSRRRGQFEKERDSVTVEWNSDGATTVECSLTSASSYSGSTPKQAIEEAHDAVAVDVAKNNTTVFPAVPLSSFQRASLQQSVSKQEENSMPLAHFHSSSKWLNYGDDDEGKEHMIPLESRGTKPIRSVLLARKRRRRNWIICISVVGLLLIVSLIVMSSAGVFRKDHAAAPVHGDSSTSSGNATSGNEGSNVGSTDGNGADGTDQQDDQTNEEENDGGAPDTNSVPTASPSAAAPAASPTATTASQSPTNPPRVSYRPGELIVQENGLIMSRGLKSRRLAKTGEKVKYHSGKESTIPFHIRPDGAAVFVVPDSLGRNKGGWVYVSNSEGKEQYSGGVGAVMFDKHGNVVEYVNLLNETTMNCAGGKTPWDTWVSCEEWASTGQVYQVDPFGRRPAEKTTVGQMQGGRYEAFAYDDRNRTHPVFYVTEDQRNGPTRRWRPEPSIVDWENEPWNILHGEGTLDYLVLDPDTATNKSTGTYKWESSIHKARANANLYYQSAEGLDRHDNLLYMSCKREKMLYVIDLDSNKYVRYSLAIALFDGEPDQVARILDDENDIMYFNEDLGTVAGVHARNNVGQMFTILEGTNWTNEVAGLAFSPTAHHMYLCFQEVGVMFEITREDGYPFHAKTLNVRYHNNPVEVPWSR